MILEHNDDEDLLRAAMSGDQEAYGALFMSYRQELRVHVYRITGSLDDVEDVIQDIYMPVYDAIQGRDPSNFNFRAYLYKAAGRRAIRLLSSKGIEVPYDVSSGAFEDALEVAAWKADEAWSDAFWREWRNIEIREAWRQGDEEKLGKLREQVHRSFREIEEPDE